MTDPNAPINPNDPLGERPGRPAAPEADQYSMDPAQQSLADALRITYRILQLVMLLLVVLFLGSGFQTIGASERGVKLTFGRVTASDVPSGSVWNWPYPVGEVVRVSTAQQRINIRNSFYPRLTADQERRPREQLVNAKPTLKPGIDGSLITADGNIAHTRWEVAYRVDRAADYINNVYQPDETQVVGAAVERGVVRAVAELEIDALLRQVTAGDDAGVGSVSALSASVRAIAQETLDAIGAGIVIEDVILTDKLAPLATYQVFNEVNSASSRAAQQREQATQFRQETLNETAGLAHGPLIEAIDAYELALAQGDEDAARSQLEQINDILDGEVVEHEGRDVTVSGEVTRILNSARQYRSNVVAEARSAATTFEAKRASYQENPGVFLVSELRSAWQGFLENARPEVAVLPDGTDLSVVLNRDPEIAREAERERNMRQADQTIQQRIEAQREARRQRQRENNER